MPAMPGTLELQIGIPYFEEALSMTDQGGDLL